MKEVCGIYKITNKINGHSYIGCSINIHRRFMEHITPKNRCKTTVMSRAFRKHGKENFNFEILEECLPAQLSELEMEWIKNLKPIYNMNMGGKGNIGVTVKLTTREKISKAIKRIWDLKSDAEKRHIIQNLLIGRSKGYVVSQETREKLRQKNLGKKQSYATIIKRTFKMRQAMKGNKNGNKKIIGTSIKGFEGRLFNSIKEAAKFVKVSDSEITRVLKHNRNRITSGGWYFEYLPKTGG